MLCDCLQITCGGVTWRCRQVEGGVQKPNILRARVYAPSPPPPQPLPRTPTPSFFLGRAVYLRAAFKKNSQRALGGPRSLRGCLSKSKDGRSLLFGCWRGGWTRGGGGGGGGGGGSRLHSHRRTSTRMPGRNDVHFTRAAVHDSSLHDSSAAVRSGSFELPFVSERLITKHKVDAVIAIGILLKSVPPYLIIATSKLVLAWYAVGPPRGT